MLDYFSKAYQGTCGRFSRDQLNKDLKPAAIKKRFSWAYVWNIILATFLLTETNAQTTPVKEKKTEVQLPDVSPTMGTIAIAEKGEGVKQRELKGIILDSATGQPLEYVSVFLKDLSKGSITDSKGNFKLVIDKDGPFDLVVTFIGYQNQTLRIDSSTDWQNVMVKMSKQDVELMGDTVIVIHKPRKKKIINNWKPAILKKNIKIYPNPVVKGNNIQASLSLKQAGEYKLELLNVQGEVMTVQKLNMVTKEQPVVIPTQSGWAPGIYLVRISTPGVKNVYQCKVSIQ